MTSVNGFPKAASKPVKLNLFGEVRKDFRPPVFDNSQIEQAAFEYWRQAGFPYVKLPVYNCMLEINKLAALRDSELRHTGVGYQVAETYHPHRRHSRADGFISPFEAFKRDKKLRHVFEFELKNYGKITDDLKFLGLVTGVQACWNFRPGFALSLYRKYCKSGYTVLDTSTGYGGRLVGFMASNLGGRYIGIDPNTLTHNGNLQMAKELGFEKRVILHNLPAEDVKSRNLPRCDFAFTSPPYFRKEHYSDEDTQSWKRYKSADSWRNGFLLPMLALQFAVLKPGALAVVNIADVKLNKQIYPLVDWTMEAASRVGFLDVATGKFPLHRRVGTGDHITETVSYEALLVFKKP